MQTNNFFDRNRPRLLGSFVLAIGLLGSVMMMGSPSYALFEKLPGVANSAGATAEANPIAVSPAGYEQSGASTVDYQPQNETSLTVSRSRISVTVPEWERTTETITLSNDGETIVNWSMHIGEDHQMDADYTVDARIDTTDHEALRQEVRAHGTVHVIVTLKTPVQPEAWLDESTVQTQRDRIDAMQEQLLDELDEHIESAWKSRYTSIITLQVDEEGLERLFEHDSVAWVRKDVEDEPHLDVSGELIGLPKARELGYKGKGQVVAVLDGGIDTGHPFIANSVVEEACFNTVDGSRGLSSLCADGGTREFGRGSACNTSLSGSSFDACRHGTSVSGQVVGNKDDAFNAPASGVAPEAGLIAIAICSVRDRDSLSCRHSDQIRGFEHIYSLRNDYEIASINMSTGGGQYSTRCDEHDSRSAIIDQLRAAGIPFITSAGNDGWTESVSRPACVGSAIAVGSTQDGSHGTTEDEVSSFSNSGPLIDFWAPGEHIVSSRPTNTFEGGGGTSRASPMVAGAWALMKSKWPDASIGEIQARLTQSAVPVTDHRNGLSRPRIQVDAALEGDMWLATAPSGGRLRSGETKDVTIAIDATSLSPGTYDEVITFTSSDGTAVEVTVEVTEQERSRMIAEQDKLTGVTPFDEVLRLEKTISNDADPGGQTLEVQIADLPDFLVFERVVEGDVPVFGNRVYIGAGQTATLVFRFKEEVQGPAEFEGEIRLTTNDPDNREQTMPVEVDVRAPLIAVETQTLTFTEAIRLSGQEEKPLVIINMGNHRLKGSLEVTSAEGHFSLEQTSFEVPAGEQKTIQVIADPAQPEPQKGTLELSHDAPNVESPIEIDLEIIPERAALASNYPNPFSDRTTIEYSVSELTDVRIEIFDTLGRRVAILVDEEIEPGVHRVEWDGSAFASGVYIVRLDNGEDIQSDQLTLVR